MSYILEALARSQTARPAATGLRARPKRALRQMTTVAVLTIVIVIVFATVYLYSRRAQSAQAPAAAAFSVTAARAAPADIPLMAPRPSQSASTPVDGASAPAATVRTAARTSTEPRGEARFSPPVALSQPLPTPSPPGVGGAFVATRSPPGGVIWNAAAPRAEQPRTVALAELKPLSALPPDARAAIAQMKVRVLFYAPQRRGRFVMIDNREVREGDELFDGLHLEEITDNGLVIRHKNMLVLSPAIPSP